MAKFQSIRRNFVNMKKLLYLLVFFTSSCAIIRKSASEPETTAQSLRFIGEYDIPYRQPFKGTTVGGLSGIDYDAERQQYYLISDDRSDINAARFYTAKIYISDKSLDSVRFIDVTTLKQANGQTYPNAKSDPFHTPDPEAIRYNAKRDLFVW